MVRRRRRKYELKELVTLVVVFENLPLYIHAHSSLFSYTIGALFIQKEEGKEKHDDSIVGTGGDSSRFNCC